MSSKKVTKKHSEKVEEHPHSCLIRFLRILLAFSGGTLES